MPARDLRVAAQFSANMWAAACVTCPLGPAWVWTRPSAHALTAGCVQVYQLAEPHKWTARLMPCASQISKALCSCPGEALPSASLSLAAFGLKSHTQAAFRGAYPAMAATSYLSTVWQEPLRQQLLGK